MGPPVIHSQMRPPRRFNRAWLSEGLRTLLWVMLITLLIWVYADIHFTEDRELAATLRVYTQWSGQPVVLEAPVSFRVKGNAYSIERFTQALAAGNSVLAYHPARPVNADGRLEHTPDLLAGLAIFRGAGVQVVSARPSDIEINDACRVLTGVPVKFDYTGGELTEPGKVEPERVDVRIPVSALRKIEPAKLSLTTEAVDLRDAPPGETVSREVEVQAPAGLPGLRIAPRMVRATYRVLQPTDTKKFTVPVSVEAPSAWMEGDTWTQYRLVVKDPLEWTKQIAVKGNRADLAKLRPEDIQAFIALTENDKQEVKSWLPGEVKVRFPPNLKVSLGEPVSPVNYRLAKRTETAAPPP